jgi:hypothetical protein
MSIKCSVLGHSFGDTDVTREREEDGSEVIITVTETETCTRCGETRVVSENKEVTTLETPSDIVAEDSEEDEPAETADADLIDQAESETAVAADADPEEQRDSRIEGGVTPTGEQGAVGGADAAVEEDDAIILEDDEDEERAPGQWPQETDDEETDEWATEANTGELRPVEDEQPDIESTGEAVSVPEGKFYCPECGFTTAVESSSLREGDFCPECHRGSLLHRSEE